MTKAELLKIAKPILFNTEMVTAILEGRKTVTRRVAKGVIEFENGHYNALKRGEWSGAIPETILLKEYAPFRVNDVLYVRETWGKIKNGIEEKYVYRTDGRYPTLGDGCFMNFKWKPSIHMPKEAARIFLKVKDVRMERLQDITEDGVWDEGFRFKPPCLTRVSADGHCCDLDGPCTSSIKYCDMTMGELFGRELWNSTINKSDMELYGWNANPWVWVIEFERIEV